MSSKLARLWATKNKDDEWWSSFVTSPLAIILNFIVVDIKFLTPNKITILSFLVACISVVFIVLGGTANFIVAAILVNLSHVLDCMDGQMARYRNTPSPSGSFFDKVTDQVQVIIWFGSLGYAAYAQTQSITPLFLAFAGVSFYSLRGYIKYVAVYTIISTNPNFIKDAARDNTVPQNAPNAGLGYGIWANLNWFIKEQKKILSFDEGVFIFMLSIALVFNLLIPVLWIFTCTQIFYGIGRGVQRGIEIDRQSKSVIRK